MSRMRTRTPSPAMVVALIALFVALGGSSYAVVKLNGKNLVDRSVPAKKLKRNSVGGTEVNERKLAKVPTAATADTAASAATAGSAATANSAGTAGSATTADRANSAGSADSAKSAETAGSAANAANADKLGGVAPAPAWQALPLLSGCTAATANNTAPPSYFKDAFGIVHLRGMLSCTAFNAFNLPAGYRPGFNKFFRIGRNSSGENTELFIKTNGDGEVFTSSASFGTPSLEGVTFRAGD